LARSVQLTKNYRWSCTLVLFILILCGLAGQFILSAFVYKLNNQILLSDSSSDFYWLYSALHVVPNHSVAFFLAIPGIGSALIYFRLREIKEGTQSELVENVFA